MSSDTEVLPTALGAPGCRQASCLSGETLRGGSLATWTLCSYLSEDPRAAFWLPAGRPGPASRASRGRALPSSLLVPVARSQMGSLSHSLRRAVPGAWRLSQAPHPLYVLTSAGLGEGESNTADDDAGQLPSALPALTPAGGTPALRLLSSCSQGPRWKLPSWRVPMSDHRAHVFGAALRFPGHSDCRGVFQGPGCPRHAPRQPDASRPWHVPSVSLEALPRPPAGSAESPLSAPWVLSAPLPLSLLHPACQSRTRTRASWAHSSGINQPGQSCPHTPGCFRLCEWRGAGS